jgi:hypothetical protein
MPESAWSMQLSDLRSHVGHYVGYGRGVIQAWNDEQLEDIDAYIDGGLRQFYWPPILPGETRAHDWSFLKPNTTLTTTASTATQELPATVSAVIGDMTYSSDGYYSRVKSISEELMRNYQASNINASGRPAYYCIRSNTPTGSIGQRLTVTFFPEPDDDYTLSYTYHWVMPKLHDDVAVFPVGGPIHAETCKQSCLAYAEQRKFDQAGLETARFMTRLAASVSLDRDLLPDSQGMIRGDTNIQWIPAPYSANGTPFNGVYGD